ncbi:MAG: hypothetical protein HYX32_13940 [Actinobacteria bacterium]|nr:hypothetical protein [Actinomycetota bacterium]
MAGDQLLVIVDADTLAGWRRPTSSLRQLHEAVEALKRQAPEAVVAVIADASLKWALSEDERELIEHDIVSGALLFAPAGCVDGHVGFIGKVVEKAKANGFTTVAITDQAVPHCPVARVSKNREGQWVFDLDARTAVPTKAIAEHMSRGSRRRRRG